MNHVTITEILDDLRAADETIRRFERRYWLSSADFFDLYSQGMLDDGEHTEEFAVWAAFYEIKLDREQALQKLSRERLKVVKKQMYNGVISIVPPEPALSMTVA